MGMLMRRRIREMKHEKDNEIFRVENETTEKEEIEPVEKEEVESEIVFTYEELSSMTVKQIKEIAEKRGYIMTKIIKDDVISEFMLQQK